MADRSDYTKSRTNLIELQSDAFNSEVNKSLVENTFNRFLTKDETVEVIGTIGERDVAARVDRQIDEDTVHRQAYQLQPLIHHKVATVDYATSSKDMLNELSRLGVDIDRLPKWGDTERFNYAPPVDLDKLVNFTDYYWYDPSDKFTKPQYVVMKTQCAAFSARLSQKQRDIAGIGDKIAIYNVSQSKNEIVILNNVASGFTEGMLFDITGSFGLDGVYTVKSVEYRDGFTYIVPEPALANANYGGGSVAFNTIVRQLIQQRNAICDGTSGWDSSPWDDNDNPANESGVKLDDPMLLEYIREVSQDTFDAIVEAHPEYVDGDGNVINNEAQPLWKWLGQPKPEFIHKWDWTGSSRALTDWQIENKWVHKLDLPPGAIAKSTRAVAPIIEYLGNLELNEWSYTAHSWMYRSDPIREAFVEVDFEPSDADYTDPEFLDKWIYVEAQSPRPVNHQTENTSARLMSIDSDSDAFRLSPYVGTRILKVVSSTTIQLSSDYNIAVNDKVVVYTLAGPSQSTVAQVIDNGDETINVRFTAGMSSFVTSGDVVLMSAGSQPFNAVLFPEARRSIALAGQQNTRVYVDGREQIGNYAELLLQTSQSIFSAGVLLDDFVSQQSEFEIGIDPSADVDKNRNLWNVRTPEWINDQDYRDAGRPTQVISPVRYRYHQQHKPVGITKFPLFDIYYPNGDTAFRANEIFTYVVDQSIAVESNIGLRVKRSNDGRTYHFKQLLLDYDNGPMFCYKDFDEVERNPSALFTIWRTSDTVRYVPRYVNADRQADGDEYYDAEGEKFTVDVPYGSGDWEVPSQLYYNASHENRIEITSIELLEHAKTILRSQPTVEGFRPNPQYGHRMADRIDYGVGGTIHEHNDSWDLLASAVFASNSSPIDILNFAATAYEGALSAQEDFILTATYAALLNDDIQCVGNFSKAVIEAAIKQYELNDNNNLMFGDSSSFINGKGIASWPATAPIMGLSSIEAPSLLVDKKLNIAEVKHHDGHMSWNRITQGDSVAIAKRVIRTKYKDARTNQTRYRGWTTSQAAVGTELYSSFTDIPVSKLNALDYWMDGAEFKRFEVVAMSVNPPSNLAPEGSLWLRTSDNQLMVRTDTVTNPWTPLTVNGVEVPVGVIESAWKDIDLTSILNDLILEIENRLCEAALEHNHTSLKMSTEDFIKDSDDLATFNELHERAFLEFAVKRQIAYPYASIYVQTDPFSWNYSGVDANQRDDEGRTVNIWSPHVDNRDVAWKATWQGTYREVYGTYYPHLEPWVLQGFTNKPEWWDAEYADVTGDRRWSDRMWANVIANRIPAAYDAPAEFTRITDPVSGSQFKVMSKRFNYVPVNTSRPVVNASGTVIYNVDDLFPLYDSRLLDPSNNDIANSGSIGKPMIRRPEAIATANLKGAYLFGDYSPIELQWRKSTQYIYDLLKIAFLMQPMRFMHKTWGLKFIKVGGLDVNSETNKVFAHGDTIFHGDVIDGETYTSVGLNQWYVNYVRRSGIDFKVSNFRELWMSWTAKLAYQFGGFINTRTFDARTAATNLIKEDYSVFSKKAPGYDTKWMDALNITVANYGNSRIRNGVRVPVGDGKDWTFTVSLPADTSRVINYYGTRRYNFEVVDLETGTFKLSDGIVPWNTGDVLYVDATGYLPFPLDQMYTYYAIPHPTNNRLFQMSRTPGGAHRGEAVPVRTEGEGVLFVGEVSSAFFAYAGERTDIEWKHHVIDKQAVYQVATPFAIQGVQGLIDFVDGYAEFKRDEGFIFNDSTAKETDQNTGRLLSWQTEMERAINTIYAGLGRSNTSVRQYGNVYEIEIRDVNEDPDTFVMKDGLTSPFQYGDKVYLYTTATMPGGVSMNTPYYVIPNESNPDTFQLASTALNAYDEIAINVTSNGSGRLMVGAFNTPSAAVDETVEINPFRYNLWIETPNGILSDVFTGGESSNSSEVLIYDQYGRPLPKGSVLVFRNDKVAHVNVRANMLNDVLVNNTEPSIYTMIHLGGMKAYIDGYEHVVMFNNYMTNGQLVYDGYIGMSIPRFSVNFERAEQRNLRPNMGGYFLDGSQMVRNIESQVSDMRNYYKTYGVNENAEYVHHARALLGYEEPTYLDHLNTPQKSKFAFWKGMIQRKGSRNAVQSFINSEHFVDAKVDEFWAYKVAEFGDARPRFKPKVRVLVDDAVNNDLRLEFTDAKHSAIDERFTQITLEDQTRWINLPSVRKQLEGRNMAFDAKSLTMVVDVTALPIVAVGTGSARKLILDQKLWGVTVQYLNGDVWTTPSFTQPNDRTILLSGVDSVTELYVIGYVPDTDKLDPIELIDQLSQTTVARTKYWNPIAGKHYYLPAGKLDFVTAVDPAMYDTADWGDSKLGWTWFDTSAIGYVPYDDQIVYPEFNDRIERWGRPAEWASADVYEWVRSDDDPIFYSENNVGLPLQVWQKRDDMFEYHDINLRPVNSFYDHDVAFTAVASQYDNNLELGVYVNGARVVSELATIAAVQASGQTVSAIFGLTPADYVTFILTPSADQIENEEYRQAYKYVVVNENDTPVYYFWVKGRTEKNTRHNMPVSEIASLLLKPQAPYHVFLKFFGAEPFTQTVGTDGNGDAIVKTVQLPARFTEVLVKDIAAQINADDRYVLQFTRFFNLRDGLDGGRSPLDLKNKHSEWFMFRRDQPNKIPSVLWEKSTEALMGYKLSDYENGVLTPVPSLERVIYDSTYNTTSRFGLEEGQAFVDREIGIASVMRLIESSKFDTAPVDKYVFLDQHSFDTPLNIKKAMDYIFVNFSAEAVNTIFFELMQDALASKRDYSGLLKTSFIALHGIKILETSGNVTE